jgi:hypothetical protein
MFGVARQADEGARRLLVAIAQGRTASYHCVLPFRIASYPTETGFNRSCLTNLHCSRAMFLMWWFRW